MLGNNNQRLNIILGLKNVFNYNEFVQKCVESEVPVIPISEYAQKVGMLFVAKTSYPEKPDVEAYKTLIERMNNENKPSPSLQHIPESGQPSNCGGCGGGRVR